MDEKFEPCEECPFGAKTREDCSICSDTGDDYYQIEKEYSPSIPWNAPGMNVKDFI